MQSSLDTGASAKRQSATSMRATAGRRDEIFKRIRPSTLVRLLSEREVNESVYALGSEDGGDDRGSMASVAASRAAPPTLASRVAPTSVASMASVPGSVLSIVDSDTTVSDARDLVLLDLRERDQFEQCRLPLAVSYPATMLNRDQISPELQRCRHDPSKLLVVYHDNDAATASAATLIMQKGWPSVHVLSGGFEELVESYPEVLDGQVPERPDTGATRRSSTTRTSSTR